MLNFLKNEFYKFNKYIKCKLRNTKELEIYKKDFLYIFVTNVWHLYNFKKKVKKIVLTKNTEYGIINELVYSGNTNILLGGIENDESTSYFRMHWN